MGLKGNFISSSLERNLRLNMIKKWYVVPFSFISCTTSCYRVIIRVRGDRFVLVCCSCKHVIQECNLGRPLKWSQLFEWIMCNYCFQLATNLESIKGSYWLNFGTSSSHFLYGLLLGLLPFIRPKNSVFSRCHSSDVSKELELAPQLCPAFCIAGWSLGSFALILFQIILFLTWSYQLNTSSCLWHLISEARCFPGASYLQPAEQDLEQMFWTAIFCVCLG